MEIANKSVPITLNFNLEQLVLFFKQLSSAEKKLIAQILSFESESSPASKATWESLKFSVLQYESPFDSVAETEWLALA